MQSAPIPAPPSFSSDFPDLFEALLPPQVAGEIFLTHGPRGGGLPKLSGWQWLMSKVFHVMSPLGDFAGHVKQITGTIISNSALSQRGTSIGWELVAAVLPRALRPLATPEAQPDAFYKGLRLTAVDGTSHNLRNTPAMKARAVKSRCRGSSGEPAFARLGSVVLVELGTHQPLAAAFGWENQGELTLVRQVVGQGVVPPRSLLLGDRLNGTPCLIHEILPGLERDGSALLFRTKANMKSRLVETLSDGSRLIDVDVRDPRTREHLGTLRLREIAAEVRFEGRDKPVELRLWTSLLDPQAHPALELVGLYATRWEHELFYRELKSHLHGRDNLLDAQTPESAAQEALALLMAAAVIARQRAGVAAAAGVAMRKISFAKVLEATVALCRVMELGRDLIDDAARAEWTRRVLAELVVSALIPDRKPRSCDRGLRQPAKNWKKIRQPTSIPLVKKITLDLTGP
jgi:hypothetical protein